MLKTNSKLAADTIILGFTGSIGSGCTYISKGLSAQYKYKYFCLSDILRDITSKKSLSKSTCEQLQNLGDELRSKYGNSYLVKKLFESIKSSDIKSSPVIIVDSIRNDGEVQTLKQFPYFYLFSVHADRDTRCKRTLKMKKFKAENEFQKADDRDMAEDAPYGQQVKKCNDLSDIIIVNDTDIPKNAYRAKRELIDDIYNKYVALLEQKKSGRLTSENLPSVDETLMTMAYAESQMSSCLKRKVGSVIAAINSVSPQNNADKTIKDAVHIISSGHNEVPLGTTPCVFTEHEKCYRDHLQEEQAAKYKNCPNCGEKINVLVVKCKTKNCSFKTTDFLKVCPECKNELEVKYSCPKCQTKVYREYLLGGGKLGKLLDMCRALHAEENALLNLTKISRNNSSDLVLYTTTYPCNLCANKIVAAGIKKVMYSDPYPMEDAKKTLESGGVTVEKFQGIKSSAFFRLYK